MSYNWNYTELPKNGIFTEFVPLTMRNALLESLTLFFLFPKQLAHKIIPVLSKWMSLKLLKRCVHNVPKKRVVHHTLKNWRPVTLLTCNTDYTILRKALANMLQQVLPLTVNSDQTAGIKGRTINDNTRLLNDIISYVNEKNTNLPFINMDQIRLLTEPPTISICLPGFGPNFSNWIKLIY